FMLVKTHTIVLFVTFSLIHKASLFLSQIGFEGKIVKVFFVFRMKFSTCQFPFIQVNFGEKRIGFKLMVYSCQLDFVSNINGLAVYFSSSDYKSFFIIRNYFKSVV